jgi:L-threonylcarbamoyladenylate synthase
LKQEETTTLVLDVKDPQNRKEAIATAAAILQKGGLVAFPTETVYGLGANALNEKAVKSIFAAKGRPADNPLIVHISDREEVLPLVSSFSMTARLLAEKFWPGPLTMVLPVSDAVPKIVTAGLDTVGIRLPANDYARELISAAGVPVAAPSANVSGSPSPTSAEHVYHDLAGKIDLILDGGSCEVGVESTVLDLVGPVPVVLRPGGTPAEDLLCYLPDLVVPGLDVAEVEGIPRAPGMKYRHYAPQARLLLVAGAPEKVAATIRKEIASWQARGSKVAVLASRENAAGYKADVVVVLGGRERPQEAAQHLFAALRELDDSGADIILAESTDQSGLGYAVMNRLWKASGGDIIQAR